MKELDLKSLVGEADRTILVTGLQALWRERVAALNCAADVAVQTGSKAPDQQQFGIEEVENMLRRVGAAPHNF